MWLTHQALPHCHWSRGIIINGVILILIYSEYKRELSRRRHSLSCAWSCHSRWGIVLERSHHHLGLPYHTSADTSRWLVQLQELINIFVCVTITSIVAVAITSLIESDYLIALIIIFFSTLIISDLYIWQIWIDTIHHLISIIIIHLYY